MNLQDKTIILTGVARIGKRVALRLAERGANLSLVYRSSAREAEDTVQEAARLGVKAITIQADLAKFADVSRVISETTRAFGRIDGLVHMAASYPKTPWNELTEAKWDETMAAIAKSAFLLAKAAADEMLKNEDEEIVEAGEVVGRLKGKIITIADWSVLTRPYKDYLIYNTAKAAVIALTKSLAKELAPDILVNSIAPGPMLKPPGLSHSENQEVLAGTPLQRWGGAEEIAKAALYLMEADFVTGQVITVDGGRTIA